MIRVRSPKEVESFCVHCSPFGVLPKRNRPNKWRLIIDLSVPQGQSVNDGIDKELASLTYVSVDEVVARVLEHGKGQRWTLSRHIVMSQSTQRTESC